VFSVLSLKSGFFLSPPPVAASPEGRLRFLKFCRSADASSSGVALAIKSLTKNSCDKYLAALAGFC
jgi:hypothetical protein